MRGKAGRSQAASVRYLLPNSGLLVDEMPPKGRATGRGGRGGRGGSAGRGGRGGARPTLAKPKLGMQKTQRRPNAPQQQQRVAQKPAANAGAGRHTMMLMQSTGKARPPRPQHPALPARPALPALPVCAPPLPTLLPTLPQATRSWDDHANLASALNAFVSIYEKQLKALNPALKTLTYSAADLHAYIDELTDLSVLVLDPQTKQYAPHGKEYIKNAILTHLKKAAQ